MDIVQQASGTSIEMNSSVWKEDKNLFTLEYVEMWKSLVKQL